MRTREEIERIDKNGRTGPIEYSSNCDLMLILETLLDIRDLLANPPTPKE